MFDMNISNKNSTMENKDKPFYGVIYRDVNMCRNVGVVFDVASKEAALKKFREENKNIKYICDIFEIDLDSL
jgi:hypothetical protein